MRGLTLALAALVAAASAQCEPGFLDSNSGLCACPSGFLQQAGETCVQSPQTDSCTPFASVSNNVAGPVAEYLESRSFFSSQLHLEVASDLTDGRTVSKIFLNIDNPDCAYLGPNADHTIDTANCRDVYSLDIDWTTLGTSCGIADYYPLNYYDDSITASAVLVAEVVDTLAPIRGQEFPRVTRSYLRVNFVLPTILTVNTTVSVVSEVELFTAITGVDLAPGESVGLFTLVTSVQYPYQLSSASVVDGPRPAEVALDSDPCSTQGDCFQNFLGTIPLTFSGSDCGFSGQYNLEFNVECSEAGASVCPLQGYETATAVVEFLMNDDCQPVTVEAQLSGSLGSFSDSSFTTPQGSFISGNDMFFQATLNSGVTIVGATISSVTVIPSEGLDFNAAFTQIDTSPSPSFTTSVTVGGPGSGADIETEDDGVVVTIQADISIDYLTDFGRREEKSESYSVVKQVKVARDGHFKSLPSVNGAGSVLPTLSLVGAGALAHALN